ncbi:MAG: phage major capsid protein [Alphaproteobacteria bacterium]|nr:phage major capsid protein [Alphaproteobacteria bacterium]
MEIEHATHDFASAESETIQTKQVLHELHSAFEKFKEANDERLDQIEKHQSDDVVTREKVDRINSSVDKIMTDLRRPALSMSKGPHAQGSGVLTEHKAAFAEYIRTGKVPISDKFETRSFRSSTDTAGGYLVPTDIDTEISKKLGEISVMRSVASSRQIGIGNTYKQAYFDGRVDTSWVAEVNSRRHTTVGAFSELTIPIHSHYTNLPVSPTFIEDVAFDLYAWVVDEIQYALAKNEGKTFIVGTGNNQPKGILSYTTEKDGTGSWNKLSVLHSKNASGLPTSNPYDRLIDLAYHLRTAYRQNAHWICNRKTQAVIRKIKDSDSNYIWLPPISATQRPMLLGHPVLEDENMHDIAAGKIPIVFGDFRSAYLIIDGKGTRILQDHFTHKPYLMVFYERRVGGGIKDFAALRGLKIAA